MNIASINYRNITCYPISVDHIDKGWLDWMKDPAITQNWLEKGPYTRETLYDSLDKTKSILFLACYTETGIYFGNLKLYEISNEVASFQRIIGEEKYRGLGYGKLMSELASSLLFDYFRYSHIIAFNKFSNLASAESKIKTGFTKLTNKELSFYLKNWESGYDYYIKSKDK